MSNRNRNRSHSFSHSPKHVRWANDIPPTPDLVYAGSSPPSSDGIPTPPPLAHRYLVPSMGRMQVQLNRVLAYPEHGYTSPPALVHDLTLPPATAFLAKSRQPLPPHLLAEPATNPPLPRLVIRLGGLPWAITVNASLPNQGVCVADVLNQLYYNLRHTVGEVEFRAQRPDAQVAITMAFKSRYRRIQDDRAYDSEKAKGIKWVDFLRGRVRWAGLSSRKGGPEEWVLNLQ